MTRTCAWCNTTMLDDGEPVTHTICSMCEVGMEAEMEREDKVGQRIHAYYARRTEGMGRDRWAIVDELVEWQTEAPDLDMAMSRDCPACHGSGGIYTAPPSMWLTSDGLGDWLDCPVCEGTGEVERLTAECQLCERSMDPLPAPALCRRCGDTARAHGRLEQSRIEEER